MIDFAENIDSLETMVWNFVLNPDNDMNELKPHNHASLTREELITMILPKYFGSENRNEAYKYALKFYKQYGKIPNRNELTKQLEVNNCFMDQETIDDLYMFNLKDYNYDFLYKSGVKAIFGPGTNIPKAAENILDLIRSAQG